MRHTWLRYLLRKISYKAALSSHQYVPLGLIGVFSFLGYYFIWHAIAPGEDHAVYLRLIGGGLCLLLSMKPFWPNKILKFIPFYWYLVLTYSFPFFFTFMLFNNPSSTVWLLTTITGIFFLLLLVGWVELIVIVILGVGAAWLIYAMTVPNIEYPVLFIKTLPTYFTVFIAGRIFIYRNDTVHREKLAAMEALGSTLAHEIRTPMSAIQIYASGVKSYLNDLIGVYKIAKKEKLAIPNIRDSELSALDKNLNLIEKETSAIFSIIDILLVNVTQSQFVKILEPCSMRRCIEVALKRYPFKGEQLTWIKFSSKEEDFMFLGNELLMIHVFLNLIKNSVYYVASKSSTSENEIMIRLKKVGNINKVYFRDNGSGISKKDMRHIFDKFYSKTPHGSGVGLAFCKMVLERFGGSIGCNSELGEFAEFILELPSYEEFS